jgi:hypothetical protein
MVALRLLDSLNRGKEQTGGQIPAGRFLSNALRVREAPAFPPAPLGKPCGAGASPAKPFPRRQSLGYSHKPKRSETQPQLYSSLAIVASPCQRRCHSAAAKPRGICFSHAAHMLPTDLQIPPFGRNDKSRDYFSTFSIPASASGAAILYPAAFGCSPSSASSFFIMPLSSTKAEK